MISVMEFDKFLSLVREKDLSTKHFNVKPWIKCDDGIFNENYLPTNIAVCFHYVNRNAYKQSQIVGQLGC